MIKYIIVFLFSFPVFAGGGHTTNVTNNYYTTESTTIQSNNSGIATAISASQLNFNWGTTALQGSVGYGNYDNENAITFGLGKRFGRVLVNGSIGSESNTDKYSFGAGASWTF